MKVALITRSTLFDVPGGDTIQVKETMRHLDALGVKSAILLANSKIDYDAFDLLHFFNITRPADILKHILHTSKKFVISPIWIDYSNYDKHHRNGFVGKAFNLLSPSRIEYAKTVARWLKGNDDRPGFAFLQKGQIKSIWEILGRSELLLTNSDAEYLEIKKHYPVVPNHFNVTVGINEELFQTGNSIIREKDLVICVGRIEGIKNQLNLIKAVNNTKYRLVLIGNAAPNQQEYYNQCRRIAASNITFINHLPQVDLLQYYRKASVHVLPSWYESCGLASLEAAAMGCKVVVTHNGFASSYFKSDGFYCDPGSLNSIMSAINTAAAAPMNPQLQQRVLEQYTWKKAAIQTLEAYKIALTGK